MWHLQYLHSECPSAKNLLYGVNWMIVNFSGIFYGKTILSLREIESQWSKAERVVGCRQSDRLFATCCFRIPTSRAALRSTQKTGLWNWNWSTNMKTTRPRYFISAGRVEDSREVALRVSLWTCVHKILSLLSCDIGNLATFSRSKSNKLIAGPWTYVFVRIAAINIPKIMQWNAEFLSSSSALEHVIGINWLLSFGEKKIINLIAWAKRWQPWTVLIKRRRAYGAPVENDHRTFPIHSHIELWSG